MKNASAVLRPEQRHIPGDGNKKPEEKCQQQPGAPSSEDNYPAADETCYTIVE
jgi:hypothetical protein